jgi:hypothetical protein
MEQPAAESDTIDADWFCVSCGYNLRSLRKSGRCPECNTPIPKSLRMRSLSCSSDNWLHLVRDGALILGTCNIAYILRRFAVIIAEVIAPASPGALQFRIQLNSAKIHFTLYAIELIGTWLILMPNARAMEKRTARSAIRIRGLVIAGFAASVLYNAFIYQHFIRDVSRAWAMGESILAMIIDAMFFGYLSIASSRIPRRELAGSFATLRWLSPAGIAIGSLLPSTLLLLHLYAAYRTRGFILCANLVKLGIDSLAAFQILRFARALKQLIRTRTADTPPPK